MSSQPISTKVPSLSDRCVKKVGTGECVMIESHGTPAPILVRPPGMVRGPAPRIAMDVGGLVA